VLCLGIDIKVVLTKIALLILSRSFFLKGKHASRLSVWVCCVLYCVPPLKRVHAFSGIYCNNVLLTDIALNDSICNRSDTIITAMQTAYIVAIPMLINEVSLYVLTISKLVVIKHIEGTLQIVLLKSH
jgi:hypothetical protein